MMMENDVNIVHLRDAADFLRKRALEGIAEAMTDEIADWHRADQLKACAQSLRDANTLAGEANMMDVFGNVNAQPPRPCGIAVVSRVTQRQKG